MASKNQKQLNRLKKARTVGCFFPVSQYIPSGQFIPHSEVHKRIAEAHEHLVRSQNAYAKYVLAMGEKKRRKPRGGLLHGDDPTLAKRVEEELYSLDR